MFTTLLTQAGRTLLLEGGMACLLAVILGFLFWRSKRAPLILGSLTLVYNGFLLLLLASVFKPEELPFYHLVPTVAKFPDSVAPYLLHIYLILEVAMWATALAGTLGYFFSQELGAVIFGVAFTIAAAFCLIFTAIPFYYLFKTPDTTWALLLTVALVGTVGVWLFSTLMLKGKGMALLALLWFEFFLACWIGYQAAGRIGLLLITLPAQIIFWGTLYYFSILSLPLPDHEKIPTVLNVLPLGEDVVLNEQLVKPVFRCLFPSTQDDGRANAFRSVLTFLLGTNYPYYVIEDWKTRETQDKEKPDAVVSGDPFRQFFAGPGIILTDCNHLAVTSDGITFRVCPPGLSFTKQFEQLYTDVDLRPQLRVTTIKAETKDGITASIFTFMPNRIWADGRKVELGSSYPYDKDAVLKAVYDHAVVEHKFERGADQLVTEELKPRPWHELVLTMGPPLLKEVVAHYTCNELHMDTRDPDRPRYEPAEEPEEISRPGIKGVYSATLTVSEKLRNFMARRLTADELKDLAFDVGCDYPLFKYQAEGDLAETLVEHFDKRKAIGCLAQQIQRRWPSKYIARLFPVPATCELPAKVEALVVTSTGSRIPLKDLLKTLTDHFGISTDEITIIGAVTKSLRVLIGVPQAVVNDHTLTDIHPRAGATCGLTSLTDFEMLSREAQNAWRYACCSAPPTQRDDYLQPGISWDDALQASRRRNPRVEISDAFIGKLKETMKPLGIEVVGGGISDIKVPEDIMAQRIKNWEVKREKDVEIAVAEAQARIALREQEVLGEVRLEMLSRLTQVLQEADSGISKRALAIKLFEAMGISPSAKPESSDEGSALQLPTGLCLSPYVVELLRHISG